MNNRILVIAANPDDEILGVGATIAKHVLDGDEAFALIMGEGQTSRWNDRSSVPCEVISKLHKDTLVAAKIIGYKDVFFQSLPDNRFDDMNLLDIIKPIEKIIEDIKPNQIYTHHGNDLNIDHQKTFQAVQTATRPIKNTYIKELLTFETLSSTEWNFDKQSSLFLPNIYNNVGNTIDKKLEAMACYKTELCEFPHPRSDEGIKILAQYRGMQSGFEYAEAFHLIRKLN